MKDLFDEFGIESKQNTDLFDEYGIEGPTAAETNAGLSKQTLDIDDYKKVSRLYDERLAELKAERNEKSILNMIADLSSDENGDVEFQWYNPLSWVGSSVAQNRKYLDDQIKALEQNETLIKNSMTPERFQEIKDFGAVGIYESFKKNLKWENTPVVGGFVEGYKKSQIINLMDKIKNSEELTDAENTVVQEYINDQIEMGIRGTSFGGKVVDGVARMPAFMIEYGLAKGMLGKASSVIGKTAVGQKATSVVGSVASKVSNTGKIGTAAVKVTGATGKAAGRALFMPSLTYNNYNDMRLNDMYALGENGQILFNEDPQNKATMVLKAFGLSTLTALSEDSGEALTMLAKRGVSPIFNKLPIGVRNELVKLARTTDKYKDTPISQLFTKGGYSNLLSEIGEERLEAVLGAVTGLDPQGDTYFDSVGNALMPGWEQFMVEAGVVSVAGGARSGLNYLYKKGYSSEFLKGLTTKEQDTLVESEIKKELGDITGASFQKITEGMATLKQFIEEHEGTPEAEQAIQTKKDLEFVGDQFYKMFLNAGHSEAKARRESQILQGISLWGAEETGLSPVEFMKRRFPEVKQMKLKDFQEQFAQKKQRADLNNVNLFEAVLNPKIRKQLELAEKQKNGASLLQFIKQRGGIKDVEGDLKAMDAGKLYIGLINNKDGQSIDDVALAAWENGYFPDKMERPDIDELKSAIRDELFGEKRYAYQQGQESVLKDIQDLEQVLDMLDIDYSNMSATELETAFNEAVNKYNAENNKVVEEDDTYNEDDYIPFQQSMDIAEQNEELDKVNPAYEGETININGVEKTVYNSNGERIAKSEPALRNFYNWFGDSKVVDKKGRPLVVYHGTKGKFSIFRMGDIGYHAGTKGQARTRVGRGKDAVLMPLYMNLNNPIRTTYDFGNWEADLDFVSNLEDEGVITREEHIYLNSKHFGDSWRGPNSKDATIIKDFLRDKGYDGIVYSNSYEGKGDSYIAFSPNQIKSTTNRGTFSKDSDNIYYQFGGVGAETAALDKLEMAKRAEEYGYSKEEIWQEFGWIRGEDGLWRFEISDADAYVNTNILNDKIYALEYVLIHDKLYEAYPELAQVEISVDEDLKGSSTMAAVKSYQDSSSFPFKIRINPDALSKSQSEIKSILLHEVQHAIQRLEGFATGGNPMFFRNNKDAFKQAFKDMADKKYKQALYDELFSKVDVSIGNEILDADEENLKASKEWMDFVFENDGDENSSEALELENKYNKAEEHFIKTLEKANMTVDDFSEIKKKARETAGMDDFNRVKDVKNYDEYSLYERLYGEIEARNTQARMNMSESERQATLPETTQDFSNNDAIVVFGDGTIANLYSYNPENVNIKNGVVDLTDAFEGTPTVEDVEGFIQDVIKAGDKFKTLSVDFFMDFATRKKAINKLKNNNNYKNLSDEEQERLYKYILALEKIAENSKLLKPHEGAPNTKPKKKPMVDRYYYFSSRVKINGAYFDLVFDTEKGVDDSNKKPITVHLYNIKEADGGRGAHTHDLKMPSTSYEYTITPNSEKVNSKVQLQSSQDPRGAYYKDIIYLFETANASTFMHETAHWFKGELKKFGSEKSKQMLQKVDEWTDTEFSKRYELGVKEGRYVVKDKKGLVVYDQSFKNAEDAKEYAENEIFARGFEAYLREGKAPNKYLKQAFQSFARFLQRLYTTAKDLNVALNDDIRSVFDDILGGTDIDFYLKEPAKVTNKKRTSNEEVIPLNDNESWIEALNRHLFDTVAPLEKISNLAGVLKDGQRPDLLARVYQYSKMMIEKNISDKTYYIDENGNEVNTGEGFVPIINDFAQTFSMIEPNRNKALDDFNDYLVAIRYTEDLDEIEGVKVTEDQKIQSIENIAKLQEKYGENYALFEDFANRIYSYQQRILYNLVDSGNLSEEKYNEIIKKHKHYVPFKRVFADTNISGGISGRPIFDEARTSKVIKKIKGSEKDVKNVFVSIEMNAANIIDLAYRNKVARSVAGLKTLLPEYVQPKNQLFEKAKAKVKGVEVETTIPSKQKPYGNVIEYYEDGKKKYVEVAKPIYEAMHQLNPIQAGWLENLLRVASMPAKLLRFGATSTPNFILRNFVKDQFTAFIQTDKGMKTTPINTLKALCHIIGKSDLYSQWQKSGGSGSGYYDWSETGSKKYFAELNNKDGRFVKALKWLGTLQFIQKPSQIIEESTRLGAFAAAKKAGLSDIAAAIKSREATVDFARGGDVSKLINRLVPFFNVGMQSANKLYRTAKTNPSAFAFHSLTTIAFPSIMITGYYLYGAPDEEREKWLQIPDYVRDNNWCFYIGDDLITFPKPFTVGYTGTIIEDFMIWGYKGNKPEMREWYDVMLGAAGSLSPIQTVGSLLTPVGQVVIEGMTNYNFFQGRSIYPAWMERLPAEERATKRNSQIGLAIGKALDVSPAIVDNTLFGLTSTFGRQIIGGAENMLDQFKRWNGEKVPEDIIIKKDIPLLGAIFGRIPDGTRSKSYQEFAKRFKEVSEINAAHSSKSGSEKAEYRREHNEELSEYKRLKRASDKMKRIQKQIDRVYEDPNMTSEDKTQRVIELERQITREAYNANLRNK